MKSILSYLGLSLFSLNIAHSQEMNLRDETLNIDESEIRSLERSHLEIGNNLKNIYNRARLYDSASVMDLESYETIDVPYHEDLKGQLAPEQQVEYWDVEGKKMIMRVN